MATKQSGKYASQGLSQVRRDFNVLKAVRKFRGQSHPSWEEYLRVTRRGLRTYKSQG